MSRCKTCNDVGITGPPDDRVLCLDCPLDFTDYGDHNLHPRAGTCGHCGGTLGGCRC
tara:strand:- start:1004 stop:1174 length:171 start_codon:yes stop_codon:yes gene_type:complete